MILEDPTQQNFGPVDLQTPVLRAALERSGRRFVMIIDSEPRQRKTFSYDTSSGLPSPLEFLGWAEALRTKQAESTAAARQTVARVVPAHPLFAAHRHKHRVPRVACTPTVHARMA